MPVSVFHVYRALLFIMFLFTIAYIVALAILAPDNTIFFIAALGLDLMILGYLIWLDFYNAWKGRIRIIRSNLGALAIDIGSNIAFTAFIPFLSSLEAIMERMTIGYWHVSLRVDELQEESARHRESTWSIHGNTAWTAV
ncbi:hypothetical protein BC832DRAFT_541220 [Gaertneriomyces semiglobifer]|nr:hypothetical protein BC832DRAFT_541220 [Gaertneriomyces semiglobifer]